MTAQEREYIVTADIGGTRLRLGIAHTSDIVAQWTGNLTVTTRAQSEIDCVIEHIDQLLANLYLTREQVSCLSFAAAPLIDQRSGTVIAWPSRPYWQGMPFVDILRKAFQAPIYIEDDANAAAYGEFVYGQRGDYTSLAYVTIGTGVGCGLILDGTLYHGAHRWAGELGHTTVVIDGPVCGCGKSGCLQTLASGRAIARRWREHAEEEVATPGAEVDATHVVRKAVEGDRRALQIIQDAAMYLGVGIANLVNLFDVPLVIIGGGVTNAGELFMRPLQDRVAKETGNIQTRQVDMRMASLGDHAGLMGALALAIRQRGT